MLYVYMCIQPKLRSSVCTLKPFGLQLVLQKFCLSVDILLILQIFILFLKIIIIISQLLHY